MAINKNAITRYRALDDCFRNFGKQFFIEDLIEACNKKLKSFDEKSSGVKLRQVLYDIDYMESEAGGYAPIERYQSFERNKPYYRYSDPEYSYFGNPFKPEEREQLKNTLLILNRFKGLPQFEWMNDIMCRLDTTFKLNTTTENIVGFDENPDLSGLEHFSPLFNAIINKQALKIKYAPAFGNIEINTIHPYYLKQYNNRWFLFALNHSEEGKIKNYALDRIEHIEVSKINYIENTIVEFENYFDDVVGVSVPYNKESQTIRLKIDRKSYNYIKTKPLHHTQKELKKECTDEYAVIELKLIPNYEFETVLLGFADSIDILEPQSLKDSIYRRAGNILKRINPAMQI